MIQPAFNKFYQKILLTKAQKDDAKKKHTNVCKKLHDYYYSETTYNGATKLLIGSYGKKTHIKPARDIDVIFKMPTEKFTDYDDNQSNCQGQLLQDVRRILKERYPDTTIRTSTMVIVLEFAESNHNVELLPCWENPDGTFKVPDSSNGGRWKTWDPKREIEAIESSQKSSGVTRRLIRMVKKWQEGCGVKLKSYQIENGTVRFLETHDVSQMENSEAIKDLFESLLASENDEGIKSHLKTALKRSKKALSYAAEDKFYEASMEWKKIFGNDFPQLENPKDDEKQTVLNLKSELYRKYPSPQEEFLEQDYKIQKRISQSYMLELDANVDQNGFRANWLSEFLRKRTPLKKSKTLIFQIVRTNVPEPYDVMWKVRNFGDEAQKAGDLRGEITYDKGSGKKKENTKYKGEHYVECYIIKDNVCVASAGIFVPIGDAY